MKKIIYLTIMVIALPIWLTAQQKVDLDKGKSCSYYGEKIQDEVYGFSSTQEAVDIIKGIVNIIGLEQNFDIMAANVPNALATIRNNKRLILYSQNFIMRIKNATGTDWAGISILAHEIGHHLNGHTIMPGGSRPKLELQADKFSGFVCAKMGATLEETQAAINKFASPVGSSTHPPKSARLEAIALGWNQAKGIKKPNPIKTKQVPTPTKQPKDNVVDVSDKNTASIQIIYTGDNYGCNLPISINIGGKIFNPTSNPFNISGIPLGEQTYAIRGQINCQTIGSCNAAGQGYINITENATVYIGWKSVNYGQCQIWLYTK